MPANLPTTTGSTTALTQGVSHVGLTVPDLEATVKFFEALGFQKVGGVESYPAIFVSDGTCLLTIWKTKVDEPQAFSRHQNIGLHHLSLKVSSLELLEKAYQAVSQVEGVRLDGEGAFPPERAGAWTHFIVYEPCGIRVEFTYHGEESE